MTNQTYTIQPATKEDIKPIAHLISTYLGTMNFVPSSKKTESQEQIQLLNEQAVSKIIKEMIVAKTKDGQIIGACGVEDNKQGDFYNIGLTKYKDVAVLVVDETFRRQSIGSNLLKTITQNSSDDIVFEAWGDTGLEANAHGVLIKTGFIHLKRLPNFYQTRGDCPFCIHRKNCNKSLCTCDIYVWHKNS